MNIDPNKTYTGAEMIAVIQEISQQHADMRVALEQQRNAALGDQANALAEVNRLKRLNDAYQQQNAQLTAAALARETTPEAPRLPGLPPEGANDKEPPKPH